MREEVKSWLTKAFEDYTVVVHELNLPENEMVASVVCFHCQQFVEKLLKAFLVFHRIEFPRTHNLEFLKELCARCDKDFKNLDFGNLSQYAIEARYKEGFYIPSAKDAKEYFGIARTVKDFVFQKLGFTEEDLRKWLKERKQKDLQG